MVIPWLGVPLGSILAGFQPTSKAKYVAFRTLHDPVRMPGQQRAVLHWPYREGLTIAEVATAIPVFGNDVDADGDNFVLSSSTTPSNGTVFWGATGVATYTPAAGFVGSDSFTYSVVDEHGAISNTATVSVTVSPGVSANAVSFLDRSDLLGDPSTIVDQRLQLLIDLINALADLLEIRLA